MVSELRDGLARGRAGGLERDLRGRVDGEVRFDAGTRGAYSTDASNFQPSAWIRDAAGWPAISASSRATPA